GRDPEAVLVLNERRFRHPEGDDTRRAQSRPPLRLDDVNALVAAAAEKPLDVGVARRRICPEGRPRTFARKPVERPVPPVDRPDLSLPRLETAGAGRPPPRPEGLAGLPAGSRRGLPP